MRLGLSHLADLKFRHSFKDCLNPKTFFEKINLIDSNILQQSYLSITKDLFFGSEKLKDDKINALLTSTVEFSQSTERLKYQLFQS